MNVFMIQKKKIKTKKVLINTTEKQAKYLVMTCILIR
jgi:hypothetical protein